MSAKQWGSFSAMLSTSETRDIPKKKHSATNSTKMEQALSKFDWINLKNVGTKRAKPDSQRREDRKRLAAGASEKEEPAHPYIIDQGESALAKVETIPTRSVTFFPNEKRQQTHVILHNKSDRKVMFKMKSTRPGLYKMKPVLGVINPGEKYSIRLVYLGIKIGYRIPLNDRITIVLAAVSRKGDDKNMFKGETEGEMRKRRLYVLYRGVNDKKDLDEEDKKKSAEKAAPKGMDSEDQKACVSGYDEGYKAALTENMGGSKEYMGASKALEHLQKTKNIGKQRAFQQGFTEGYEKARALLKSTERMSKESARKISKEKAKPSKESVKAKPKEGKKESKEVLKVKGPSKESAKVPSKEAPKAPSKEKAKAPSKEEDKLAFEEKAKLMKKEPVPPSLFSAREPEPFMLKMEKLSDGRNVTAVTPGGTDASLGDQLRKQEFLHISPGGKRQIVIIMYRDQHLPENLISRSGDEDDEEGSIEPS
ncbi:unnamed protein product [Cylicocyclus nassatus]|uniref:Major sperm protein n=1 Tax=Cylicocyclus nassatus TaxID=53992 RepID=A0AA36GN11_CYLNA|nr:unnamed protein product [Cylicocyclus nassatus]